jgi:hypothetical protein
MKIFFATLIAFSFFLSSLGHAKWIDPEKEAKKNRQVKAWKGVEFTFTGVSSSTGTNAVTYRNAINDFWEWSAGAGVDSLGWFFTGGGNYFLYNWPNTTCFFAFPCHGQVLAGANLYYANGGRRTYTNNGVDTIYDQGNSIYTLPQVAFRSIYREFFSLTLDVGYRVMIQKPGIRRSFGPSVQSNVDDMEKANVNGVGASVSLGIVF